MRVDEFLVTVEPGSADPTTVYRFFGTRRRLLYVGITNRGHRRINEHAKEKAWWRDVRSATFEHFPTREEALWAEAEAIRSEDPAHNVHMGHPGPGRPGSLQRSEAGSLTVLSRAETLALLDQQARRYFEMSGLELLHAWHAGEISIDDERFGYVVNLLAQIDG